MLRFFRSIRQRLVKEGKTSKYVRYAFGEIALIVVGILIALQISNWNEGQIAKRNETAILKRLQRDLAGDFEELNEMVANYKEQSERMKETRDLINQEQNTVEEVRKLMRFGGVSFRDLNVQRSAYDGMVSSGLIYNLSQLELVDEIVEYYRDTDNAIYNIRQGRDEYRNIVFGPNMTDYWVFMGENDGMREARALQFFADRNSLSFKTFKQTAAWGVAICSGLKRNLSQLADQNRRLGENIDATWKENNPKFRFQRSNHQECQEGNRLLPAHDGKVNLIIRVGLAMSDLLTF